MRISLLILTLLLTSTFELQAGVLDGARLSKHLYGDEITPADLEGKIVFFEYWGINCPPCRASFPHLVELQSKYASTGKFTIFASHVQSMSDKVVPFLESKKVNFPVYHGTYIKNTPSRLGLPLARLFDEKGNLVAEGSPNKIYPILEELMNLSPAAIVKGIEVKKFKKEASKLVNGTSWSSVIKALEKKSTAGGEDAEEAKQLIEGFKKYLASTLEIAKNQVEKKPSAAYGTLTDLSKKAKGFPEGDEAKNLSKELSKDKNVKRLLSISAMLEKLKAKGGLTKKKNAGAVLGIRKALEKLIADEAASAGAKSEAESILASL